MRRSCKKPNLTLAKVAALAESDEEAVDGFAPPLSCGWQRKCQRLFLWKRPVNVSAKTGRTETSRGGQRRVSDLPEQGVKGNAVPFGGVKRRQSLIGVPG